MRFHWRDLGADCAPTTESQVNWREHPGGTQLGPVRKLTTAVLVERNLRFYANSWQRLTLGPRRPRRFRPDATHSPAVNSDQFSDV